MDQNTAGAGQSNEQDLFKPDGVVVSDGASTPASSVSASVPASDAREPGNGPVAPDSPVIKRRQADGPAVQSEPAVTWTASEFIAHHKSIGWYAVLAVVALGLAAGVYFFTKDRFSTVVVIIGAVLLGVYATHKPRELVYTLDEQGLTIGERHHFYREFRSFSIIPEGAFASIELTPLKRFAMYTTIYFDPADGERIVGTLSAHLPLEERRSDPIDLLMRQIRF